LPSPIAHTTVGYLVYRASRRRLPHFQERQAGPFPVLLVLAVVVSMLPDLDAVLGAITGDLARFHNNGTHSLIVGAGVALLAAVLLSWRKRSHFLAWFWMIFASYGMHTVLDFFTYGGRGVMLFWPLSPVRFDSPFKLFYGVRWSEGWISTHHLWTIVSEFGFVLLVFLVLWLTEKLKEKIQGTKTRREWLYEEK
jgi:inner membrane protein